MVSSSFTNDNYLTRYGYQLFPTEFSMAAYLYLINNAAEIGKAYLVTIIITVIGTLASVTIVCMLAYPLSLTKMPGKRAVSFILIFTMLFNGGLVPTYTIYSQYLHMKNSYLALIVPGLLMNAFSVLLVRNYFVTSIPQELYEASRIDGASEIKIFTSVALPLSKPIIATIGLMAGLTYWNDWFNGMLYLSKRSMYSIQVYLNQILQNVQFLAANDTIRTPATEIPNVSIRMAIAVVAVLPIVVVYPFLQKYFVKGITMGAVKG
jgi:putative aldouronate transport system permease protein